MKIKFIGTCACDYSPRLKTDLKDKLDKDARRSSCALVDGHLMIDCGHHAVESLKIQNIPFSDIKEIFFTHLHGDHYQPENVKEIAACGDRTLLIYAHKDAQPRLSEELKGANVKIIPLNYCQDYMTESGYTVAALPANHNAYPSHYLIEKDGKKLYYALDGAWVMYDAFYYLKNKKLDMLVLDATVGDYEGDYRVGEHNSIPMIRLMLKSFDKFNVLGDNVRIFLSHIAPSLNKSHDETVELMKDDNIEVAFDGLEIDF
ncbi:MAG: hypothetical protein IKK24_04610 [Clostridia bacterium]|nr:hypothetical protein [Clostridia bacterium]